MAKLKLTLPKNKGVYYRVNNYCQLEICCIPDRKDKVILVKDADGVIKEYILDTPDIVFNTVVQFGGTPLTIRQPIFGALYLDHEETNNSTNKLVTHNLSPPHSNQNNLCILNNDAKLLEDKIDYYFSSLFLRSYFNTYQYTFRENVIRLNADRIRVYGNTSYNLLSNSCKKIDISDEAEYRNTAKIVLSYDKDIYIKCN